MIYPEYLLKDRTFSEQDELPADRGLAIPVEGQRMFGYALLPGGIPGEKHPCVIMLHGLPGYTTNHDIAQALRRIGFAVLNPYYRGAWGSEGYFSLSGMIADAMAAVRWCRSAEAIENFGIDPDSVFLAGISMGGWAALHTIIAEPEVRGAVVMAPADIGFLAEKRPDFLVNAYQKYGCLNIQSPQFLSEEAHRQKDLLGFQNLIPGLKNKKIYLVGGNRDVTIPPDAVLIPMWKELQKRGYTDNMRCEYLNTGHSFADCRMELIPKIGCWLAEQVQHAE